MAYQKPYTFRAGTYAKAAEVNANFDTLKDFVNELLTTFQEKIVGLQVYNKANKEGDASQIFKAAQGTNANDVVINSQLTTTNSRVTTLEQAGNWVPPSYDTYTNITGSGIFSGNGVLRVTNSTASETIYIRLDDTAFTVYPQTTVCIPIKSGTTYQTTSASSYFAFFAS